jgi:hypothetical protein
VIGFTAVLAFVLAASVGLLALVWSYRDASRSWLATRQAKVAEIEHVLDLSNLEHRAVDFPVVTGRWQGMDARIELHTDAIVMRKLPALWLLVTLKTPLNIDGAIAVMKRPLNTEYWSPFDRLPDQLTRPDHWPEHTNIRCQGVDGPMLISVIEKHLDFLAEAKGKEILITPQGVRLAWLAEEGDRSSYLIGRQVAFSTDAVAAELARRMLERCGALAVAAIQVQSQRAAT